LVHTKRTVSDEQIEKFKNFSFYAQVFTFGVFNDDRPLLDDGIVHLKLCSFFMRVVLVLKKHHSFRCAFDTLLFVQFEVENLPL